MITIRTHKFMSPTCRCCESKDNVMEILFKSGNSGTLVSLCKECRKKLVELIKQADE